MLLTINFSFFLTFHFRLVTFVLVIESLYIVHLVGCDGEVLVLASGKEGILIVKGVGTRRSSLNRNTCSV